MGRPDPQDLRYALVWRRRGIALSVIAEALEVPELTLRLAMCDPWSALMRRKRWTAGEDAILRRDYPDWSTAALARRLGRSPQAVKNRTNKLGLRKTAEWRSRHAALTNEIRKPRKSPDPPVRNPVSLPEPDNHGGT